MPMPKPYHPGSSANIANNLPAIKQVGKVVPIPIPTQPPQYSASSSQPSLPNSSSIVSGVADDEGESFDVPQTEEYEQKTTSEEALNAMKDLLGGAVNSVDLSKVNLEDAVVDGFIDSFRLLPHQVQGRAWMRERESGKKAGGILADVSSSPFWTLTTLIFLFPGRKFDTRSVAIMTMILMS